MNIETLINATPHAIVERVLQGFGASQIVHDPSGVLARVQTPEDLAVEGLEVLVNEDEPDRYDTVRTIFTRNPAPGVVVGLPEPMDGVVYIVSGQVLAALEGVRSDVVAPATDPRHDPVRNERGHIVAVRGFVRNP